MMRYLIVFQFIFLFFISSCTSPFPNKSTKERTITKDSQNYSIAPEIPPKMVFAGDTLYFHDLDLKERLDRELIVNTFWHSKTILEMKRARRWFPLFQRIFEKRNIPQDLIYIAVIESGLQNVRSYRGANGFWQIMPETAKELGLIVNDQVDERLNIKKSTIAACKYLQEAYRELGSWSLAVAAYNRGVRGIKDALESQQVKSYYDLYLNTETARYVFRVLAIKIIFESPEKYGFFLQEKEGYPPYQTKEVVVDTTIVDLTQWSLEHGISTKILHLLNPWLKENHLEIEKGEQYTILLPKGNKQLHIIGG